MGGGCARVANFLNRLDNYIVEFEKRPSWKSALMRVKPSRLTNGNLHKVNADQGGGGVMSGECASQSASQPVLQNCEMQTLDDETG